jgi:hypothetical protein
VPRPGGFPTPSEAPSSLWCSAHLARWHSGCPSKAQKLRYGDTIGGTHNLSGPSGTTSTLIASLANQQSGVVHLILVKYAGLRDKFPPSQLIEGPLVNRDFFKIESSCSLGGEGVVSASDSAHLFKKQIQ